MTWYTASVVMGVFVNEGVQDEFPVWENFYLIEAASHAEAETKAEAIARDEEAASATGMTYKDRPAREVFLGVRMTRSIYQGEAGKTEEDPPADGSELFHNVFEFASRAQAERFARNKVVAVIYEEDTDDD